MLLALTALLLVVIFSMKYCRGGFWPDYIAKPQCNVVKGIFILLVFLSHFASNIAVDDRMTTDWPYFVFQSKMGQLVVALFLFYSGYGVMKSIMTKGRVYIDGMPRKRLLTTMFNFDIAVLIFVLLAVIVRAEISPSRVFLSLLGWESAGNSNWYIFVIVSCYFMTWCVARLIDGTKLKFLLLLSLLVLVFACGLSFARPIWWYDTTMCYILGVWYSRYEEKVESCMQSHYCKICLLLISSVLLLTVWNPFPGAFGNLRAMAFSLLCVLVTMKFKVDNQFLCWCGAMLFPLYIYQRLPMIVLGKCFPGLLCDCWIYVSILICFSSVLCIARFYHKWRVAL